MQAPSSTFKIPIVSGQITILAVSERTPTYYDFCFADASCNSCCWLERTTFPGISHSGDLLNNKDLLDYVRIDSATLTGREICVFISGYQCTQLTRFLGTSPALLVADHVDKAGPELVFFFGTTTLTLVYRFSISSRFLWMQRQLEMRLYVAP